MDPRRDIFHAIADPTRRRIISLTAHRRLNVKSVAGYFTMSRPAISQHMRVLEECGLVVIKKHGRERFCEVQLHKLDPVAHWIALHREFWTRKLDALESHLVRDHGSTNRRKPRGK